MILLYFLKVEVPYSVSVYSPPLPKPLIADLLIAEDVLSISAGPVLVKFCRSHEDAKTQAVSPWSTVGRHQIDL